MAKQKPVYTRIAKSKSFRNREQADEWAAAEKDKYGKQGVSARTEVNYDDKSGRWSAKIYIKATGSRSVERPDES